MAARYPLLVDLAGRPCLVVGGGAVAERKVSGLLAVGAAVTVIAPTATPAISEAASRGELVWHARRYVAEVRSPRSADVERWWFAVAATDDAELNHAIAADASAVGTWANDASAPDGGPVSLPAVHRRGPITLAVATGGVSPGAASWLRDLTADAIVDEHLTALDLAAQVQDGSPGGARPDWRAAVGSGMLDLIREGRVAEAKERLQACLSSSSD